MPRNSTCRREQAELRCRADTVNLRAHIGLVFQPETQHVTRSGNADEICGERIVGIDDSNAARRQRRIDRALGLRNAFERTHALQVRGRDVVDQRDFRTRDGGKVFDIAGLARAHFQNRVLRIFRHR